MCDSCDPRIEREVSFLLGTHTIPVVSCACLKEIVGKEMKTMRPGDH